MSDGCLIRSTNVHEKLNKLLTVTPKTKI